MKKTTINVTLQTTGSSQCSPVRARCQKVYPIHSSSPHSHPLLNSSHSSVQKTATLKSYSSLKFQSSSWHCNSKIIICPESKGKDCLNHRNGCLNQSFYFARAQKIFFNCLSQPALLAKPQMSVCFGRPLQAIEKNQNYPWH